ncbi:alkaline phosphatase family protein [Paenibacillus sp. strain BS8-2]
MNHKVLLILVDGMRPDSLSLSGHPYIEQLKEQASYTLTAQTVMPSVTLPCHMSLFHSVPPERHGIMDNIYTPQVRPIAGLCEQLKAGNKTSALFYNWEELRDVARPGSTAHNCFLSGSDYGYDVTNGMLTDMSIACINEYAPDFTFLYLGEVDVVGHKYGWMSKEYIEAVYSSWACIERVIHAIPEDYNVIVTADHGGHDRTHGTMMPEDMTIPLFVKGKAFASGAPLPEATIIDIAPTIVKLLGVTSNKDWEGKPLV